MSKAFKKIGFRRAVTLMELVIAVAMVTIIFAVVLPQFVILRNSWDVKQGSSEALQNGRVLMDHINRNLSKAVRISAVSESSDTDGYIEFEDNDGNTIRFDIAASNYVEYGVTGNLSELAGPVSSLLFTCYDACDLDTPLSPVTDVNDIRVVKVDATFTNSASMGQDKTFSTRAYLRVNSQSQDCWSNQDIGSVAAAGTTSSASCVWTIEGSGADIWNNSDEFHYVYQTLSGNGQIIARVVSVENTDPWAKAGVMIRETLTGGSKHAMMVVTPGNGTAFQRRTSTGGVSTHTAGSAVVAPYWVKLIRSGNTFSGYESANGSAWTLVSSDTVTMTTDVYVGLAVTSHNDGVLCTAVIDNVSFSVITYETFNEAKAASDTTSLTISTPSTNTGDLLIAAVATDGDTSSTLSPPAGWTTINVGAYSSEVTLGAWRRIAAASEPASHQFTWTGAQQAYGWMMRFTNHDPTNPINAIQTSGQTSGTPTSPAVTTTVDNCMILRLGAFDDDDITMDNPGLSGHTAITMDESAASSAGAVTYQTFGEGKRTSNNTSVTITAPAGVSAGDLLIAVVVTDGSTSATIVAPVGGGWTLLNRGSDSSNQMTLGIWWKLAGASEPANYTFTWTGNEQAYGWIMRFTGHDSTNPINAWQFQQGASTDSTPPCPSVNTTVASTMIVRIGGFDRAPITVDSPGLAGHMVITMDRSNTGNNACSGGAGYVQQPAIGPSGTVDFTLTGAEDYRTFTIAIAPASVTGTVSGGAGYVRQSATGGSGTSTFTLGSSNEAQMLTIAIAPNHDTRDDCCGEEIRP